jgi:hypothetical protein
LAKFTPIDEIHPFGPGVKLRMALWLFLTMMESNPSIDEIMTDARTDNSGLSGCMMHRYLWRYKNNVISEICSTDV